MVVLPCEKCTQWRLWGSNALNLVILHDKYCRDIHRTPYLQNKREGGGVAKKELVNIHS